MHISSDEAEKRISLFVHRICNVLLQKEFERRTTSMLSAQLLPRFMLTVNHRIATSLHYPFLRSWRGCSELGGSDSISTFVPETLHQIQRFPSSHRKMAVKKADYEQEQLDLFSLFGTYILGTEVRESSKVQLVLLFSITIGIEQTATQDSCAKKKKATDRESVSVQV